MPCFGDVSRPVLLHLVLSSVTINSLYFLRYFCRDMLAVLFFGNMSNGSYLPFVLFGAILLCLAMFIILWDSVLFFESFLSSPTSHPHCRVFLVLIYSAQLSTVSVALSDLVLSRLSMFNCEFTTFRVLMHSILFPLVAHYVVITFVNLRVNSCFRLSFQCVSKHTRTHTQCVRSVLFFHLTSLLYTFFCVPTAWDICTFRATSNRWLKCTKTNRLQRCACAHKRVQLSRNHLK